LCLPAAADFALGLWRHFCDFSRRIRGSYLLLRHHDKARIPSIYTLKSAPLMREEATGLEQKEVAENDSGQAMLPPVTLIGESHRSGEKG